MLHVNSKIFETFPGLHVISIVAENISNSGHLEDVTAQLRQEESRVRDAMTFETLSDNPHLQAWRDAYVKFGAKPKEHRSSIENLYRLILQGRDVRSINRVVDIYNVISLRHMLPLGAEDLDKISGAVELTFAGPSEPPVQLLGDKEAKPPSPGEVIYKDNVSAICRRFNWREADRTKLTDATKRCILVIEALPPATLEQAQAAAEELCSMLQTHCGARTQLQVHSS